MEQSKYLLLIDGQDRTDDVANVRFQGGICEVTYTGHTKTYRYNAERVKLIKVEKEINPSEFIITVDGRTLLQVERILDFGSF